MSEEEVIQIKKYFCPQDTSPHPS